VPRRRPATRQMIDLEVFMVQSFPCLRSGAVMAGRARPMSSCCPSHPGAVSPAFSRFCDSVLPPPSQNSQHENDIVVKKMCTGGVLHGGVCPFVADREHWGIIRNARAPTLR
ncbi:MAG: hypothetical protein OXC68_01675, partial [Aestuariivita sp.]|nr:hypothetical protein [Aestuariivita sp.]